MAKIKKEDKGRRKKVGGIYVNRQCYSLNVVGKYSLQGHFCLSKKTIMGIYMESNNHMISATNHSAMTCH